MVGYSQTANIASRDMQLLDPGGTPSSLPISFALLNNSMNPMRPRLRGEHAAAAT
ncbi:PE-PPE domain protein [Mycobacterium kansasii 662]|uniref:PE-PPE domain protein n=2 Tax=Mycobacterium kansasii TaxID=1768 RepID=A0A1V3X488_MYCKA|nr:PE-PPE domain protein [Mycobacterium kansasii 824]EUA16833.1 PE-PPE domain protein [Mycobacterium kansasii 662]KEP41862.1 hypothetical protein MKSMC1_30170 [Mycobacterium kansasii]OOK74103.1 PE-PPE domain protein [Mycobacterium kansasii]